MIYFFWKICFKKKKNCFKVSGKNKSKKKTRALTHRANPLTTHADTHTHMQTHKHTHTYTVFVHDCSVAAAVFHRWWWSHVLEDFPINKQRKRKSPQTNGNSSHHYLLSLSFTNRLCGSVKAEPQKYTMWWAQTRSWERTNGPILCLNLENYWHTLKNVFQRPVP